MATSVRLWPLFVLLAALSALPAAVRAQEAPQIADGGVTNAFPAGMEFAVSVTGDSPIEELRLRYMVLPDGTAASGEPEFEPGTTVETTFQLAADGSVYLAPGTQIDYYWEATDADGDTSRTETQTFFYIDARFEWESMSGEGVTINYYSGSEDDAREMHEAAQEVLARMSALLGATVPFGVQVWTYDSSDDMRPALRPRSETYESQITTAGVRVASNAVLVLGNNSFDTLRHELTHVVTALAGKSALGAMPWWLDEGTAVYGQDNQGGFEEAIRTAISRGNVLSVREISSFQGEPAKVQLSYGQAWSLVSFLIDEYGEEKFAQLFAEVQSGKRIESALQATYGFGQDGLEDDWRAANDLPPRATEEPSEPDQPAPDDVTPDSDDGGGTSIALVIGLAVGVIALASLVGLGGVLMARRL